MEKHVSKRKALKRATARLLGVSVNELGWKEGELYLLVNYSPVAGGTFWDKVRKGYFVHPNNRPIPGVPEVPKPIKPTVKERKLLSYWRA